MRKQLLTLVAGSMLLGCASPPPASPPAAVATLRDTRRDEAVLALLLADMAAQHGDYAQAAAKYTAVAEQARDAELARRAVQAALYGQDVPAAIAAAQAWQRIEPQSVDAAQLLTGLELQRGNAEAARTHLRSLLALKNFSSRQDYLNLVRLLNQNVPPETLLGVLDALLESRPDDPEALFAYSLAATGLGQAQRADKPSARLLELQPGVDEALLLRAQVLLQTGQSQAASELLRGFLKAHPRHAQARLTLARVLLEEKDYAGARDAFETVLKQDPANGDARLAAALLAGQLGDRRTARAQLLKLAGDEKRADQANFYLGKLAEDAGNPAQAIDHYARVKAGEHYLDALLRRANLLAQQGDLDAGVALLAAAASESEDNRTRLLLAQSDLLLQGNRALQAEALINEALAQEPDSMDLLFARSMVLEKLNRTAEMEQDLRRILEIDPKNANALNAWGYTLADRGERLDEAHTLISRALEQSPDNPYILDSLGWVLFRKGDLVGAESYLRRALSLLPDAEVYAHLAEVLHAQGRTDEARKVLAEGLDKSPKDARLLGVQSKLDP
ncbi:tetratricopeptide repeat protein [Immundisolibacter sp.]|uniref:tetratricopeptide repeat protein n=1 Tax=Immundisolibacter sp. TaxID=1934948 RepID=UPI002B16E47D|nr:tetratricopeptide repeat protein [Immundisolibacter sp.]MEA3219217.1 Beta-barrel assembly-enhancing protease [Immundisolibacter sp.]